MMNSTTPPCLPAGRLVRFTSLIGLGTPPVQVYQPLVGWEFYSITDYNLTKQDFLSQLLHLLNECCVFFKQ
jgi:hypothetical protein